MILKLNTSFNLKQFLKRLWKNQEGVFPPFMFGLLMGVTLFSAISLKMAEKQLVRLEETRSDRLAAEREDLVKGLEFSLLTETAATYSDDLTLERAKEGSALSAGKTLGKSDVQFIEHDANVQFGVTQKRVLIANTDDTLNQAAIASVGNADDMSQFSEKGKDGVAIFDSSAIRYQQVQTSIKSRDTLAETLYRYYATHLKFPDPDVFANLADKMKLSDAWGNEFVYLRSDDQFAVLTFIAPWGEEYSVKLDMR